MEYKKCLLWIFRFEKVNEIKFSFLKNKNFKTE